MAVEPYSKLMGSNDKLKTAKIAIDAEDMAMDGMQSSKVRKPKKKERQKGKKVIEKELLEHGNGRGHKNYLGRKKCKLND